MKRTRSVLIAAAAAVALVASVPSPAGAADGDSPDAGLTATIDGVVGTRSVLLPTGITTVASLSSATVSGTYSIVVDETSRTGTNPWSLTGAVTAALVNTLDATKTIPTSAIAVDSRSVLQTLSGGTSAAPSGSSALGSAATLFSNTGQSTTAVYTGTHTASGTINITPPNGTSSGVYTGTLVLNLVQ